MEWARLSPPILVGNTPVQLLAAIVESSDDAIVAKSLAGTVLSWNRGAEELYGYPAAEMVGQNITAVIPADRADELAEILARVGGRAHRALRDGPPPQGREHARRFCHDLADPRCGR